MMNKKTLLILGAGASAPVGYPSGRALLMKVANELSNEAFALFRELRDVGYRQAEMEKFRIALAGSMQPSVDAFLEKRPDFLDIGKAAIAAALIPMEQRTLFERGEQATWYEYLFNRLGDQSDRFHENQLSIVTFNYDRSLEYFLYSAIVHS